MFRKSPRRTIYSSIFLRKFRIWPFFFFFIFLHDSNSIFRARGINSEWVRNRTVSVFSPTPTPLWEELPSDQFALPPLPPSTSPSLPQTLDASVAGCVGFSLPTFNITILLKIPMFFLRKLTDLYWIVVKTSAFSSLRGAVKLVWHPLLLGFFQATDALTLV